MCHPAQGSLGSTSQYLFFSSQHYTRGGPGVAIHCSRRDKMTRRHRFSTMTPVQAVSADVRTSRHHTSHPAAQCQGWDGHTTDRKMIYWASALVVALMSLVQDILFNCLRRMVWLKHGHQL
ncbi:hypothetical protein LX36DRAFT_453207 [Colletotrichum falcatum]|nr:hypothetical protein LX36DRAFT_453207 [Colletotrichum falcatum]